MTRDWPQAVRRWPFAAAFVLAFATAVAYTALDVMQPCEPLQSVLALLLGTVACAGLFASGLSGADLRLRLAPLSIAGAGALAATTLLMLPILTSSTGFVGWRWLPALVYAPASGVAQELCFRSALLPALERALPGKRGVALIIHSVLFVAFHLRTFAALPSVWIGLVVAVVIFLAGCGWGWQVQRDRTVVWAVVQHSFLLAVMSMFAWG
jgi:hypothetical protein